MPCKPIAVYLGVFTSMPILKNIGSCNCRCLRHQVILIYLQIYKLLSAFTFPSPVFLSCETVPHASICFQSLFNLISQTHYYVATTCLNLLWIIRTMVWRKRSIASRSLGAKTQLMDPKIPRYGMSNCNIVIPADVDNCY
jgi:hypothetical protein